MPEDYLPGLRAILDVAARQSPTMLVKSLEVAQAEAARYRAAAALYPVVSANANYSATNSSVESAVGDSSRASSGLFYGVNVSQNLFQWGAVKAGADIAAISQKIAERSYAEAYRSLAGSLRAQYLSLIVKKAALSLASQRLALLEQDVLAKRASIALGESAPAEIAGIEMNRDRAQLALDVQLQDLAHAKRLLMRLAGQTDLPDAEIPGEIPLPQDPAATSAVMLRAFLQGGAEMTPQAEVFAYYLRQNELNVTIAKSGTRPKFSVGGGYGLSNSTSVDGLGNLSQAAVGSRNYSVNVGWTIWDSGSTKWNTRAAIAAKSASERVLLNYLDANRDDARQKEKQTGFAYREMLLAERDRLSALNGLNLEKENLELGLTARTAVERAALSYGSVDLAALSSRAAFLQQWSEFVSLVDADPVTRNLPASFQNHGQ